MFFWEKLCRHKRSWQHWKMKETHFWGNSWALLLSTAYQSSSSMRRQIERDSRAGKTLQETLSLITPWETHKWIKTFISLERKHFKKRQFQNPHTSSTFLLDMKIHKEVIYSHIVISKPTFIFFLSLIHGYGILLCWDLETQKKKKCPNLFQWWMKIAFGAFWSALKVCIILTKIHVF